MAGIGTAMSVAQTLFVALECSLYKEACSMMGYESNLEDLKRTVRTVESVLLDAGNKTALSQSDQIYIQNLKDSIYDADDLFDEFLTLTERKQQLKDGNMSVKVRNFLSSKNPMAAAYFMSRQVKKIRKKLNAMADDRAKFGFNFDTQPLRRRREETHSYVRVDNVIGREDDATDVIHRLLDSTEDVGFLAIVGVGGLGKTTIAKLVFGDDRIKSVFVMRLWVCVSDQDRALLDLKEILSKLIESAGFHKPDSNSSMELVQSIYQHIFGGNKCFIVLDDIWNESVFEWQNLRELLMISERGSRILATTRSKETARIIGNGKHANTYELSGLSKEHSWCLFERTAFREGSKPLKFVQIGQKIVEKCSNLPLAINVVGSLLFGQPIDNWQAFVTGGFAGISSKRNETMSILKFSYDYLEPSLKSCFIYCALFPKDFVINKDMIMELWEAQGYIVPFDEGQSIGNAGEQHFSILRQRCFFQDVKTSEYGDVESFKIHDLMHDLAQTVSANEIYVRSSSRTYLGYIARHLFEAGDKIEDYNITKSKIRSHLLLQNNKLGTKPFPMNRIIKKWLCLRVLALNGLRIQILPGTMDKLLHLRYLNLANNDIEKLPDSIANLYNLQTLNVNNSHKLKEWPNNFSNLVNLTHLHRGGCTKLSFMPVGMSKLTRLRMLTDFVVNDESPSGTHLVRQLDDLKALAVNLKGCLSIQLHVNMKSIGEYYGEGSCLEDGEHLKEVLLRFCFPFPEHSLSRQDDKRGAKEEILMEKLRPHPNLKGFQLYYYSGEKIAGWGRAQDDWATFLPNLVNIQLWECHQLQQLPVLSKLLHLKSLNLCQLENLEYMEDELISNSVLGSSGTRNLAVTFFPSLESLEIRELGMLKGWWRTNDSSNTNCKPTFPRLCWLTIECCPNLTSFPPCPSLRTFYLGQANKELMVSTTDAV